MTDNNQYDKIIPALLKAQGTLEHAKKDSSNPHFKSKYADLATVLDTCKPVLQENKLLVTHQRESSEHGEYLVTTLWHESGQNLVSRSKLNPVKNDPQGIGSAITYYRRYDLSALIGLASDDDDGNAASGNNMKPAKPESAASRNKRYAAVKDALLNSDDPAATWHEHIVEINEFKNDPENGAMYYEDLTNAGKLRRQQLQEQSDFAEKK